MISPLCGLFKPNKISIKVDFPEPDFPLIPIKPPRLKVIFNLLKI